MKNIHILFLLLPTTLFAQWIQVDPSLNGDNIEDTFGRSISLNNDGTRIAIGAYLNDTNAEDAGQVKVFDNINSTWVQVGQDILGQNEEDYKGAAVALNEDGTILVIGSMGYGPGLTGRVSVYKESNGVWSQMGSHIEGASSSVFGQRVAISSDGTRIVMSGASATGNGSVNNGLVQVYEFNGIDWFQLGQDIWGEALADFLGTNISMNATGNRIAMSAPMHSGASANNVGRVYMYELEGNTWVPLGQVLEGTIEAQELGRGIVMNDTGDLVAVGSANYLNTLSTVQVYKLVEDTWIAYGQELSGVAEDDRYGSTLDFNGTGTILAVSAPFDSTSGFIRGAVRLYQDQNENWVQVGDDIYGEADEDRAGISIHLTALGDKIAIASPFHNGPGGSDSGHVRTFLNETFLSINQFNTEISFQLFPNPTTGNITIQFDEVYSLLDIKVCDILGSIVFSKQSLGSNSVNVGLGHLESGVYFVSVLADSIEINTKIIKE